MMGQVQIPPSFKRKKGVRMLWTVKLLVNVYNMDHDRWTSILYSLEQSTDTTCTWKDAHSLRLAFERCNRLSWDPWRKNEKHLYFTGFTMSLACYFPQEFQGEYTMQSTMNAGSTIQYSSINITSNSIPIWGTCHKRIGNNFILMIK